MLIYGQMWLTNFVVVSINISTITEDFGISYTHYSTFYCYSYIESYEQRSRKHSIGVKWDGVHLLPELNWFFLFMMALSSLDV